jgi:hypothetical protein
LAGTMTTLNYPGASSTTAYGIDNGRIVGTYAMYSHTHGFIYDGTNWTPINKPGAINTNITGIDGSNLIGTYDDSTGTHAFLFNGTTWNTLYSSSEFDLWMWYPRGISGNKIVGNLMMSRTMSYISVYDITTAAFTTINNDAVWTAWGIDGDNIVGVDLYTPDYGRTLQYHGFLYNGSTWQLLDAPGASRTEVYAIDGSNIVGIYQAGTKYYNFLYNGSTWKTLDDLPAISKIPNDIEGDKIVGYYSDGTSSHGFVYTIPEPCTLMLLSLGAAIIVRKK